MPVLIEADQIWGGYYNKDIIKGISFSLSKGDFLGVIGPNGSGKTTLLRLLSRVILTRKGAIRLEGRDILNIGLKEFCRKVAFVPQETLINFPFSVSEIVMLGRIPHLGRLQSQRKHDYDIVKQALSMTDTTELEDKRIDELSSGERQRVIIAKALAQEPGIIFLDEPTSHLDIGHQMQVLGLLRKLNLQQELTIIMVLHDLNLAAEFCSRLILLDQGKVFREGLAEDVLTYQNIEAVYKTTVVVRRNPYNSKPYVFLAAEER